MKINKCLAQFTREYRWLSSQRNLGLQSRHALFRMRSLDLLHMRQQISEYNVKQPSSFATQEFECHEI